MAILDWQNCCCPPNIKISVTIGNGFLGKYHKTMAGTMKVK
jgi:hypothetical protein